MAACTACRVLRSECSSPHVCGQRMRALNSLRLKVWQVPQVGRPHLKSVPLKPLPAKMLHKATHKKQKGGLEKTHPFVHHMEPIQFED